MIPCPDSFFPTRYDAMKGSRVNTWPFCCVTNILIGLGMVSILTGCGAGYRDADWGTERLPVLLGRFLSDYKDIRSPTVGDPPPTWDKVFAAWRGYYRQNEIKGRVGDFIANGYRDYYGDPIAVEKVHFSGGSFEYRARLSQKSKGRLGRLRGYWCFDLKDADGNQTIETDRFRIILEGVPFQQTQMDGWNYFPVSGWGTFSSGDDKISVNYSGGVTRIGFFNTVILLKNKGSQIVIVSPGKADQPFEIGKDKVTIKIGTDGVAHRA